MGVQVHRKPNERPKTSCLYYIGGTNFHGDGPRCSLTTYAECNPDACPWYRSQEMADESYEKARQIWAKNHGRDDYYQLGYGPKRRMLPKKNPDAAEEVNAE